MRWLRKTKIVMSTVLWCILSEELLTTWVYLLYRKIETSDCHRQVKKHDCKMHRESRHIIGKDIAHEAQETSSKQQRKRRKDRKGLFSEAQHRLKVPGMSDTCRGKASQQSRRGRMGSAVIKESQRTCRRHQEWYQDQSMRGSVWRSDQGLGRAR